MSRRLHLTLIALLTCFLALTPGFADHHESEDPEGSAPPVGEKTEEDYVFPTPLGLPDLMDYVPEDNKMFPAKIELGRKLFWDTRLSPSNTFSCETCHHPEMGWADGKRFSVKANGKPNSRHTPSLYNVAFNEDKYYWDGRKDSLEAQLLAAWKGQMGAGDQVAQITQKIAQIPGYKKLFDEVYGEGEVIYEDIVDAIATFVRTILSGNSAYDRYKAGDDSALTAAQKRGLSVFSKRCASCHAGPVLTNNSFHNLGIGMDEEKPDIGRAKPTKNEGYRGAFKTPTLRSITTHPPYSHDGRFATLKDILDYFGKPVEENNPNLDPQFKGGIPLTEEQKADLIEFLKALDGEANPETAARPALP